MLECIELPGWSCVQRHCDGTLAAADRQLNSSAVEQCAQTCTGRPAFTLRQPQGCFCYASCGDFTGSKYWSGRAVSYLSASIAEPTSVEPTNDTLVAILFAGELRLPDHPEDRAHRLAYINAWTVGATSLYVSVSEKEAADVRLLSRVTWADAVDVPAETPGGGALQFWRILRCWKVVLLDERRRLGRRHDWYFRARTDFILPLRTACHLAAALWPAHTAVASQGHPALFMESDRFFGGRAAAFDIAAEYFARRDEYPEQYCTEHVAFNYTLVTLADPIAGRFEWLPLPRAALGNFSGRWHMWSGISGAQIAKELVTKHITQVNEYELEARRDATMNFTRVRASKQQREDGLCFAPTGELFGSEVGFLLHLLHHGVVVKGVPHMPRDAAAVDRVRLSHRLSRGRPPPSINGTTVVPGSCGVTQRATSGCAKGTGTSNGSWALRKPEIGTWRAAFATCQAHCQACSGCRWFSFSPDAEACRWYRTCPDGPHVGQQRSKMFGSAQMASPRTRADQNTVVP